MVIMNLVVTKNQLQQPNLNHLLAIGYKEQDLTKKLKKCLLFGDPII